MPNAVESIAENQSHTLHYRMAKCGVSNATGHTMRDSNEKQKVLLTRNNSLWILLSGGPKEGIPPENFLGNFRIDQIDDVHRFADAEIHRQA